MDVIASVAFGTQVDSQKDPDDPFVYHAQTFFSFAFFRPIMFVFIAFPFLAPLARVIPNKRRDEMNNFFNNCIQKIIRQRDEQPVEEDSPYYSNVQDLKYLDMVISEALRLYPPGFRFARDVDEDCVVNGQFLPKGATLEIPAGDLHYDPEYWPEPEKFIPDRFPAEAKASRHPFVYLPFGAGPRSCVGMRLAQLEIKMALVHVFRKFNIVASTDTKVPLELKSHSTLGPKNGIYVKITKRGTEGEPVTPPAEEE